MNNHQNQPKIDRRRSLYGKIYPNGKTREEILRSPITIREMAEQLGVTIKTVCVLRSQIGVCKNYKLSLLSLKGYDTEKIMKQLICPRCGKMTINSREGWAIYCTTKQADGTRCMYHYTKEEMKKVLIPENKLKRKNGYAA